MDTNISMFSVTCSFCFQKYFIITFLCKFWVYEWMKQNHERHLGLFFQSQTIALRSMCLNMNLHWRVCDIELRIATQNRSASRAFIARLGLQRIHWILFSQRCNASSLNSIVWAVRHTIVVCRRPGPIEMKHCYYPAKVNWLGFQQPFNSRKIFNYFRCSQKVAPWLQFLTHL